METNNKFFLYDSYVFAFKNAFAQIRVFALSYLVFFAALIPIAIIAVFFNRSLLFALRVAGENWRAVVLSHLVSSMSTILFFSVLISLFLFWVGIGIARISLTIHDEGSAPLQKIFPSLLMFLKAVIALSLSAVIGLIGLVFFIVPGIYWAIRVWFLIFAIADGEGIFEAFSTSFRITRGKGWYILGQLLATIILCSISILTLPVISLSNVYLYRYLKKENA